MRKTCDPMIPARFEIGNTWDTKCNFRDLRVFRAF